MVLPGRQAELPPEELLLELLLDEELDELDEELELLDEDELPAQLTADGPLPVTASESRFARPPLCVATSRILLTPAASVTVALVTTQVVHAPLAGNVRLATFEPFTCTEALRSPDRFA